jgi:hypothetical protein
MGIKLKALGLGLLAALAVGGVGVVSAPADSGGVVHSDVEWTHIKGAQEGTLHQNVFITPAGSFTCKKAEYTASIGPKTVGEITVTPTYGECGLTNQSYTFHVEMNGCAFVLTFTDKSAEKHHTGHLECPKEKEVTITKDPPFVGECIIHIPPQTPTAGGVAYTNKLDGTKHSVTLDITVEGITYTETSTGFGCGHGTADTHRNDTNLIGTVTATGFDTGGNQVNLTVTTASS